VTVAVAGADGCRAGWVVAVLHPVGSEPRLDLTVVPSIGPVVDDVAAGRVAALAVDMPIGLPDSGPRACDIAARRTLGPRRSSVFPAPVRSVVGAATYAEALVRSRAASGRGLSKQAFNLVPAIAELDAALTPARRAGVVEAHPEMAFARLAGAPCAHPKRTAEGRAERLALLAAAGLGDLSTVRLPGSAPDDVLDAAVLTLTAARAHAGTADRLGDGTLDARGLAMEIVV
jgi:predicted RNase H-like nuclease